MIKIAIYAFVVFYVFCNLVVAHNYSARDMRDEFVRGQCRVGKFCANVFYAPAWVLKAVRMIVVASVK